MKYLLLPPVLLFSSLSFADDIVCTFTEPFYTSTYKMSDSTLTYVSYEKKLTKYKNVTFKIKGPAEFTLSKNGRVLQTLKLTKNGSDGMTDSVYPYEVQDNSGLMTANNGIGGCESDELKATEPSP